MRALVGLFAAIVLVVGAGLVPGIVTGQSVVTLTVTVETPDGDPVSDAQLIASWTNGSSQATTAANGKAFIDVAQGAEVRLEVDHPDYVRNHPVMVTATGERTVAMTVRRKASATITVQDEQGPVAGVLVTFRKDGRIAARSTTDANGEIRAGPIEAGTYAVTLRKSRYLVSAIDLAIEGEESETLSIRRGSLTLTFNVTDDYFSPPRPIEDATITVADVGSVQTQANGIQQISVPVNTRLTARIAKGGYQPVEQSIMVGEQDRRLRVHLRRVPGLTLEVFSDRVVVGERVLVEVTDEYGQPVEGAAIHDGELVVATTDDAGQARVAIESAGTHQLMATMNELSSEQTTVTGVAADQTEASPMPGATNGPGLDGFGILMAICGVIIAMLLGRFSGS